MCYTKELSISSFLVGLVCSIFLIKFGNPEYASFNNAIGFFYIFISVIQFLEYCMWADIKCQTGLNKMSSTLMPFMIYSQPIIYGLLLNRILPKSDSVNIINNKFLIFFNFLYVLLFAYYYKYSACTQINDENHLSWQSKSFLLNISYNVLLIINSLNYIHHPLIQINLIWSYGLLLFSSMNTKKNLGELWCFTSTATPLLILLSEKLLLSYN